MPDIPLEVIRRIKKAAEIANAEVVIVEIGGTVGEYQNLLFLEAARMMKIESPRNVSFVMVSYFPTPGKIGEMKTKPTQYAVRTLNGAGIQPDLLIARGDTRCDRLPGALRAESSGPGRAGWRRRGRWPDRK